MLEAVIAVRRCRLPSHSHRRHFEVAWYPEESDMNMRVGARPSELDRSDINRDGRNPVCVVWTGKSL